MRIAIDIRSLTDRHLTGVGFALLETLKELFSLPTEHHFVLFASGSADTLARLPTFSHPHVTVVRKALPNRLVFALTLTGTPLEAYLPEPIDAWWFPNWTIIRTEKPYILTVHDLSFVHFPDFFSPKDNVLRALARPQELAAQAQHILAVSPTTAHDIQHTWDIAPERISPLPLGVDHQVFCAREQSSDRSFRAMYDLNRPYVLSLATQEPRKNLPGIIEGFLKWSDHAGNDLPLVIAGAPGWKYAPIHNRKTILELGYIPAKHRPALLRGARAVLFPSFFEGFGLPVLEALACGTPVITTASTAPHTLFGDTVLSIDAHNSEDIARALALICEEKNHAVLETLRTKGLALAKTHSWEKTAQSLLTALNSVKN